MPGPLVTTKFTRSVTEDLEVLGGQEGDEHAGLGPGEGGGLQPVGNRWRWSDIQVSEHPLGDCGEALVDDACDLAIPVDPIGIEDRGAKSYSNVARVSGPIGGSRRSGGTPLIRELNRLARQVRKALSSPGRGDGSACPGLFTFTNGPTLVGRNMGPLRCRTSSTAVGTPMHVAGRLLGAGGRRTDGACEHNWRDRRRAVRRRGHWGRRDPVGGRRQGRRSPRRTGVSGFSGCILLRLHRLHGAQQAHRGHGRHPRRAGLLAGGLRRRDLQLR